MKGKSVGWLILVGALAVPALLFYKWWTQMKATQAAEARQTPAAGTPFGGGNAPAPSAPAAPKAPAPTAPAAPAPKDQPSGAPPASPMSGAPAYKTSQTPAPAPATLPPAAPGAPAQDATAAPAVPPASAATTPPAPGDTSAPARAPGGLQTPAIEYAPKSSRDPMLSVFDLRELAKQRLAKEMAQKAVEDAAKQESEAPPPPPPKPLCDNFDLQGIVSTPNGIAAIINDSVRNAGDHVGGAVIERITTRTVVFRKGRKTCMKRVSK